MCVCEGARAFGDVGVAVCWGVCVGEVLEFVLKLFYIMFYTVLFLVFFWGGEGENVF